MTLTAFSELKRPFLRGTRPSKGSHLWARLSAHGCHSTRTCRKSRGLRQRPKSAAAAADGNRPHSHIVANRGVQFSPCGSRLWVVLPGGRRRFQGDS